MGIKDWSTTAASNNSASPNGFPEGMSPSGVNDSAREMMATLRAWYEAAQWINLGHTPTRTSGTAFTVATDLTATYAAGRRLQCNDGSTLYGVITSSSYSAPNTTVNVTMDSGSLTTSLSGVAVGILTPTSSALPPAFTAPFADTTALVKGSADSTKQVRIEVDGLTTATTRVITMPDADVDLQYARASSDTAAGGIEIATQSEMEAASSTSLAVTPGRQQYHPSASKFWVKFNGTTGSVLASHNVSGVTRNSAGNYTVTFTTSFSSGDYGGSVTPLHATTPLFGQWISQSAGSAVVQTLTDAGSPSDATAVTVVGYGDQ